MTQLGKWVCLVTSIGAVWFVPFLLYIGFGLLVGIVFFYWDAIPIHRAFGQSMGDYLISKNPNLASNLVDIKDKDAGSKLTGMLFLSTLFDHALQWPGLFLIHLLDIIVPGLFRTLITNSTNTPE